MTACNWELIKRADYESVGAVKWLLFNINDLIMSAENGDSTAASIYVDLKTALSVKGVLTYKQRKYLHLWHEGYSITEIATKQRISLPGVLKVLNTGIRNISNFLNMKG